jgi:hypothetical protein
MCSKYLHTGSEILKLCQWKCEYAIHSPVGWTPKYESVNIEHSNMTSFKRFESKPAVRIILIYDRLNLWRHRQFITIFYQFLHIRIVIIHGSHMYILFLPRVGLYVSFLLLAFARGKTSWHKGLPVVKTIYTYGFHELFLKYFQYHDVMYKLSGWEHLVQRGFILLSWQWSDITSSIRLANF